MGLRFVVIRGGGFFARCFSAIISRGFATRALVVVRRASALVIRVIAVRLINAITVTRVLSGSALLLVFDSTTLLAAQDARRGIVITSVERREEPPQTLAPFVVENRPPLQVFTPSSSAAWPPLHGHDQPSMGVANKKHAAAVRARHKSCLVHRIFCAKDSFISSSSLYMYITKKLVRFSIPDSKQLAQTNGFSHGYKKLTPRRQMNKEDACMRVKKENGIRHHRRFQGDRTIKLLESGSQASSKLVKTHEVVMMEERVCGMIEKASERRIMASQPAATTGDESSS